MIKDNKDSPQQILSPGEVYENNKDCYGPHQILSHRELYYVINKLTVFKEYRVSKPYLMETFIGKCVRAKVHALYQSDILEAIDESKDELSPYDHYVFPVDLLEYLRFVRPLDEHSKISIAKLIDIVLRTLDVVLDVILPGDQIVEIRKKYPRLRSFFSPQDQKNISDE